MWDQGFISVGFRVWTRGGQDSELGFGEFWVCRLGFWLLGFLCKYGTLMAIKTRRAAFTNNAHDCHEASSHRGQKLEAATKTAICSNNIVISKMVTTPLWHSCERARGSSTSFGLGPLGGESWIQSGG